MKYIYLMLITLLTMVTVGCTTPLPAEDIKIFEVCKDEIAVLRNPKIPRNSKEKYEAARSLAKKIDFSYTRTVGFLGKIFLDADARVNRISNEEMVIIMYYPYEEKFISFEFFRFRNHIHRTNIRYK